MVRRSLALFVALLVAAALLPFTARADAATAVSPDLVVSQVYGGGGNTGAQYTHDYIELFNRGSGEVTVTGWSLQYASSTGSFTSVTELPDITLQAGEHYLVQESAGAGNGVALPTADHVDPTPIFMSATSGKVALVDQAAALSCGSTATPDPCTAEELAHIVDLVGYGSSATMYEGSGPTGTLSNTTAAHRDDDGCVDTDDNAADFTVAAPAPRNTGSTDTPCGGGGNEAIAPTCGGTLSVEAGVGGSREVSATDPDGTVVDVDAEVTPEPSAGSIALADVAPATEDGGTLTADLVVSSDVPAGSYSVTLTFTNDDDPAQTAQCQITVDVVGAVTIMEIQGETTSLGNLTSPLAGQRVRTSGVVTAVLGNGFFIQDPTGDGDPVTSDGVFVFTGSFPSTVSLRDVVVVDATVTEFRRSGTADLTLTELTSPIVTPDGTVPELPAARPVNAPNETLRSGIIYWERREGMRVHLDAPHVVGPTNNFGEFAVLDADDAVPGSGYHESTDVITVRHLGGQRVDYNPERLTVDDETRVGGGDDTRVVAAGADASQVDVAAGDLLADLTGVVDYQFSLFRLQPDVDPESVVTFQQGPPAPGANAVRPTEAGELSIVSFNVENTMDAFNDPDKADSPILSPEEVEVKMAKLTLAVHDELRCPDVILVQEVENATVLTGDADGEVPGTDHEALVPRLAAQGCPYGAVSREATDDRSIEQAVMWRTDRDIELVSYYLTTEGDGDTPAKPDDQHVFDGQGEFGDSREPLVAELLVSGEPVIVMSNHLASKGGDDPLFGTNQPPIRSSEEQRKLQAEYIREYLDEVVFAADPDASVVVGGDLNDFPFPEPGEGRDPVTIISRSSTHPLKGVLNNVPEDERWTYIFQGNAQILDHLLVGGPIRRAFVGADVAHFDARYGLLYEEDPTLSASVSDHDPPVGWFDRSEL